MILSRKKLGPKLPIVNAAFMDLGAEQRCNSLASSNAARYNNGNALDIRKTNAS
jgi:hypothetical protein